MERNDRTNTPATLAGVVAFGVQWVSVRAIALAYFTSTAVAGHDFWLQPAVYRGQPDVPMPMTLLIGHGPERQRSRIAQTRITRFEAVTPEGGSIDLRNTLHLGVPSSDGTLNLQKPGTYVLLLETDDQAKSFLPALRFNEYLLAEGLTLAVAQRERTHRMDADGSENYRRIAKSIVQVGSMDFQQGGHVTAPLGLSLEIVPEVDPYALPQADALPIRVIDEGRPLEGALVKLTNIDHDADPTEVHRTDKDGRAIFKMPTGGNWLLNVVWTKPQPPSRDTDFETIFSSLSFGFR